MNYAQLLDELRLSRELVTALVDTLDDATSRTQFHPDLSPPGWHLGHCAWTECFWLQEVVAGDTRFTDPVRALYTPSETPRSERGARLPELDTLLQWTAGMQSINDDMLASPPDRLLEHPLMQDNYLLHFLIQHYSQHYETLLMILTQRAIQADDGSYQSGTPLPAVTPQMERIAVQPGHYRVGGSLPVACDNELPQQQATLGPYSIARRAVSNSEYLAFMQADGYGRSEYWSEAGRAWLQGHGHTHPNHWRTDRDGHWYGIASRGPYELAADDPVSGISYYEAEACAHWAGGRLPHEHQWEVACRLQLLEDSGRAWEWCGNTFYPYEGFRPFPYENYSQPWFDGKHYCLRGGSLHTRPSIRRASFRNFYTADKRHVFAGVRPVFDTTA